MTYPTWDEIRNGLFCDGRTYPMIADETPTFMGRPHATGPEDLKGADAVIIGAPYATSPTHEYAGVKKVDWLAAPKRIRQQSARYRSGYIQDFDLDVFEHLKVVDYGDADIPADALVSQDPEIILAAQAAVEVKVNHALDAGALPVVLGQNSPCGSYAIAKCVSEHTDGDVGVVSLDTHWDAARIDTVTMDPRIAGGGSWLQKMLELQPNISAKHLIEIGPRGMMENPGIIRELIGNGARFISGWDLRKMGIEAVCEAIGHAYDGTDAVYAHFDMDVMGGSGPAPGDILGELAEPIGMTDYEAIRIAHELGLRGVDGFSFICIPPGPAVIYRVIVYVIMYLLAGKAIARQA